MDSGIGSTKISMGNVSTITSTDTGSTTIAMNRKSTKTSMEIGNTINAMDMEVLLHLRSMRTLQFL